MTYEYIKDVRFAEMYACFDLSVYVYYLLTGHERLNAFLFERYLNEYLYLINNEAILLTYVRFVRDDQLVEEMFFIRKLINF